jgi:hypothetical protein
MIPVKILPRLTDGLKKYQTIVKNAKAKDINESDTALIVTDIFADIFGYEKYSEITTEYKIRNTFCDLAIEINKNLTFLIEVKAIGIELKSDHIKQAVDYGSNSGVDWVILTNGVNWKVYKIIFSKPVYHDLVFEFNFLDLSGKKTSDLEMLFMISKESVTKSVLSDLHSKKQVLNNYFIGNLLLTDPVVEFLRKFIKKIHPEIKMENENVHEILLNEVIKRESFDGDKAIAAKKKIVAFFKDKENKAEKE